MKAATYRITSGICNTRCGAGARSCSGGVEVEGVVGREAHENLSFDRTEMAPLQAFTDQVVRNIMCPWELTTILKVPGGDLGVVGQSSTAMEIWA